MKSKFWSFKNAKNDPKVGELMIYGEISESSWWGDEVTPKQFKKDLEALGEIDELKVYINSYGGDVFAGQAIYSMLNRLSYKVDVFIDGIAASAASIIAMAGDTIRMPKNAMLMIHNPWMFAAGYASDLRKAADELDKIRESIIPVYQGQTGLDSEEIASMMDAETWMTAEEAFEKGFIHEIEEAKEIAASLKPGCKWIKNIPEQFKDKKPDSTKEGATSKLEITLNVDEICNRVKTMLDEVIFNLKPNPAPQSITEPPKVQDPPKNERALNYQKRAQEAQLITKARSK